MRGEAEPCRRSGWRILIAGTGGQGVLTAAQILCECFAERGHDVVSGQLHGMAQRGGEVQSSVIIDGGISPVIARGRADFVIGFEPIETTRALPLMSAHTMIFMNTAPVSPFVLAQRAAHDKAGGEYPDVAGLAACIRAVTPHLMTLDATGCATEAGSARALNMVMLGCLLGCGELPCPADAFIDFIARRIPRALLEINVAAFRRGADAVRAGFGPRGSSVRAGPPAAGAER